jgi:hypothetical protein
MLWQSWYLVIDEEGVMNSEKVLLQVIADATSCNSIRK